MYKPKFNHVLVEIDDKDAKWGSAADDSLAGAVYREGTVLEINEVFNTSDYPHVAEEIVPEIEKLIGKHIMWNEGHEAGTVFEHDSKKFALICWWDIIGVKEETEVKE